jgi:hypothetical protein
MAEQCAVSDGALRMARPRPDHGRPDVGVCRHVQGDRRGDAGETLDEVTANVRDAVALHLEGEDLAALGFAAEPTIIATLELVPPHAWAPAPLGRSAAEDSRGRFGPSVQMRR